MMGKIVGIAAVGLTQFLLWIILLLATIGIVNIANPNILAVATSADNSINLPLITQGLLAIDFSVILPIFLLFFILGYLLYASLFAAVGATTDTDSQQFVLPITIPLILSIILSPLIVASPSGAVAQWLSMIPFTSPVAMMLRLPFGVPLSQVWLSAAILLVSFVLLTWMAARIYRIGILMYAKKTTFKEIWRWITERQN
jgi:ABC-2 type transport system permease protein